MDWNRRLNLRTAPVTHLYWPRKCDRSGSRKNERRIPIGRIDGGNLIPFLVTDPTERVNYSNVPLRRHKYQHKRQTTCWKCIKRLVSLSLSARLHDGPNQCGERTGEGPSRPQPALRQHLQWYVLWKESTGVQQQIRLSCFSLIRSFGLQSNAFVLETGAAGVPLPERALLFRP